MKYVIESALTFYMRALLFVLFGQVANSSQGQVNFNISSKLALYQVQADGICSSNDGYVFVASLLIDTLHQRWGYGIGSLDSNGTLKCFREYVELNGVKQLRTSQIVRVANNFYIKAGKSWNPDAVFLVAFNDQCDTLFTRQYETIFGDSVQSHVVQGLRKCSDGGYIITTGFSGYAYPELRRELGVYKLDKDFNFEWSNVFGRGHRHQQGIDVAETDSGGYLIFGLDYYDNDPDYDSLRSSLYFVEIDSVGNLVREKVNGQELRSVNFEVVQTADGGYILCSSQLYEESGSFVSDNSIFKIDSNLTYVWETKVGTIDRVSAATYFSIVESTDGEGVVAAGRAVDIIEGNAYSYGVITKVNWEGDSIWTRYYVLENDYPTDASANYIWRIRATNDGGYITIGEALFMPGTPISPYIQQIWFLKTDEYGCVVPGCHLPSSLDDDPVLKTRYYIKTYPNPVEDVLNVFVKMPDHAEWFGPLLFRLSLRR
ncbi:MAG TPA: hypothetical protein VI603_00725 [Saprospiraceae bacterium]|nr:hypothetical protein [Saprospiraceae bacterium]